MGRTEFPNYLGLISELYAACESEAARRTAASQYNIDATMGILLRGRERRDGDTDLATHLRDMRMDEMHRRQEGLRARYLDSRFPGEEGYDSLVHKVRTPEDPETVADLPGEVQTKKHAGPDSRRIERPHARKK